MTAAPPIFAPIIPNSPKAMSEPTDTAGRSHADGEKRVRARGAAAPTEKLAAEAAAA
jgi:hypothetical protein